MKIPLTFSAALIAILTLSSCETSTSSLTQVTPPVTETKAIPTSTFLPAPAVMTGKAIGHDKHGMPTYADSTRKRYVRTTAYSHQENEPGAHGRKNAAGTTLLYGNQVRSAAADWSRYPLGTKFKVKGLPYTYVVDDYGSALVGTNTVDMYFPSLRQMNRWGTRKVELTVIQWGEPQRSLRLLKGRTRYSHCAHMYRNLKRRVALAQR